MERQGLLYEPWVLPRPLFYLLRTYFLLSPQFAKYTSWSSSALLTCGSEVWLSGPHRSCLSWEEPTGEFWLSGWHGLNFTDVKIHKIGNFWQYYIIQVANYLRNVKGRKENICLGNLITGVWGSPCQPSPSDCLMRFLSEKGPWKSQPDTRPPGASPGPIIIALCWSALGFLNSSALRGSISMSIMCY